MTPFYLFTKRASNSDAEDEYQEYWKLTDIFRVSNVGFVSARDRFVTDVDQNELAKRIDRFRSTEYSDLVLATEYGLKDTSSWSLAEARAAVRADANWQEWFTSCLYRPFDVRPIYYSLDVLERPVYQIQRHMLAGTNVGLVTTRSIEIGRGFEHVFCSRWIVQHHAVSLKEVNYLFPLYLSGDAQLTRNRQQAVLTGESRDASEQISNLSSSFSIGLAGALNIAELSPSDSFAFIYAVLNSPTYRTRYASQLGHVPSSGVNH